MAVSGVESPGSRENNEFSLGGVVERLNRYITEFSYASTYFRVGLYLKAGRMYDRIHVVTYAFVRIAGKIVDQNQGEQRHEEGDEIESGNIHGKSQYTANRYSSFHQWLIL